MTFRINDGPFAGQEGDKVQSRVIRDRLLKEAERNIAIRIEENDDKDSFIVSGRGELQLAILIENMRREGFELTVSRPKVVMKTDPETGQRLEPIEEVIVDVDDGYTGVVVQKLSERKGDLLEMRPSGGGRTAHGVPRADSRFARLSGGASLRHPRHRHHEQAVPRL